MSIIERLAKEYELYLGFLLGLWSSAVLLNQWAESITAFHEIIYRSRGLQPVRGAVSQCVSLVQGSVPLTVELGAYFTKTELVAFTLSCVVQYKRGSYPGSMSAPTTYPDSVSAPVMAPAFITCF